MNRFRGSRDSNQLYFSLFFFFFSSHAKRNLDTTTLNLQIFDNVTDPVFFSFFVFKPNFFLCAPTHPWEFRT